MTALNEISAKIDHVPLTCNSLIVLRKWSRRCMLLRKRCFKNIRKFLEILATAMEPISRKGSFVKLVNVFWKRTLPKLFFYIATLISSKLSIFPIHSIIRRDFSFSTFPFFDQETFFIFPWLLEMKGAVVQHSTSCRKVERHLYDQFLGQSRNYFFLILSNQVKNNSEVSVKNLAVFFRISTSGTY